jgi:hypothetical protein
VLLLVFVEDVAVVEVEVGLAVVADDVVALDEPAGHVWTEPPGGV